MSTVKRCISLLLVCAILCSALPVGAIAMDAGHSYSNHSLQETVVSPQSLDLSGLSCDSFISNQEHRNYINMMLRYYINSDSKLQNALSNGLSVVFFFEGGSDNYPGSTYEDKLADIRDQAVVIVVKNNSSGKPTVVTSHETCSTLPSEPAFAIQIDGTYPIISWNHKSMYGALQIVQEGKSACLYAPDSNKNGYFGVGSGMNIHSRSSSTAGGTNSNGTVWRWSEGCLLIGTGNTSSNYFNTFMRNVAGIDFNVWINYSGKQFNTITANRNLGYCVIDRQLAKSGMCALYNNVALGKITATSDAARSNAENSSPVNDYISECTYYPSYLTVKTASTSKLWNMPCSDSISDDAVTVGNTKARDTLTVTAMYKNTQDNYWYEVTYNGTVCYIYGGNTTFIDTRYDDITFTDAVIPSEITVGNSFAIGGTIKTKYNVFQSVRGSVTSPYGSFLDYTDNVSGHYYSLKGSKIDNKLTFGSLDVGSYYYDISIYVENYYTTDGRTLLYDYCNPGMCCELFHVVEKEEHICSFDSYTYNEAAHPHYKCYKCSSCGKVSRNTSEPTKSNTCDQCRPGKGVLNVNLSSDGTATFTWANTANTTHYNVWLHKKTSDGNWSTVEQVFYAESGFQRTFGEGEYCAQLLTYSSEMWEPDGKDWVHTWADDVFFTVSDGMYTISYNANGGSGAPSSQTETVGTYIDLSWTIPTRFGYSFQGWATDSSASSVVYWPGDVYTDDTSVTLYAVWREAEVLSGDTVGQFNEIAYINCPDAGVYFAFVPNTSTEYRIMSESDEDVCVDLFDANGNLIASDDDGGEETNFLLTYNFTANETYYIYVRYLSCSLVGTIDFEISKRYYVTYDANGGTGAPETQYHFFDEDIMLSTDEPTRFGYLFVGWSTFNIAVDPDYLPGDICNRNIDLTLYAVWEKAEPTIIASGICGDNLVWSLMDDGCLTISGTGAMYDFDSGGSPWYDYASNITSVVFEGAATNIGDNAFRSCSSLNSVRLPDSVITIGVFAFADCISLESLEIPSGVTTIENCAFGWCEGLTSMNIPDSVIAIGDDAFAFCSSLTAVEIPNSITTIGSCVFGWCSSLTSISIPASVTTIGDYAFAYCTSLGTIYFSGGAPVFYDEAFCDVTATAYYPAYNSTWTEDVMLDHGGDITWVAYDSGHTHEYTIVVTDPTCMDQGYTTYACRCGDSYTDSYTSALGHSFTNYVSDHNATCTEDGTKTAVCDRCDAEDTIRDAGSATGHYYEAQVTAPTCTGQGYTTYTCKCGSSYIADYTDALGHSLTDWTIVQEPTDNENGLEMRTCIRCDYEEQRTITKPENPDLIASGICGNDLVWQLSNDGCLTISGTGAMYDFGSFDSPWFDYKEQIVSVVIEDGATSIGNYAFNYCANVTSIQIPNSVTVIGSSAFDDCNSLPELILPDKLVSIGSYAFYDCSVLSSIVIPASVTTIGKNAFWDCLNLQEIVVESTNKEYSSCDGVIYNKLQTTLITYPAGKAGSFAIPDSVTTIGDFAFYNAEKVTAVLIPDHVTSIGDSAFRGCTAIQTIDIPDSVSTISGYMFCFCESLSEITIPSPITLIECDAFAYCDNLAQITFEGNAPVFEEDIFLGVTAEAHFPADNSTWTTDVMQDYGGAITWIPSEDEALPFTDVPEGSFYYAPVAWAVENGITNGTTPTTFSPNDQCMRAHVVTFLWRAMGSPEPKLMVNPFVDVKPSDFYYKPVLWALENGITSGMDATHFGPTSYCNRAQVVTFLYRTMGSPDVATSTNPFTDVTAGSFYEKPVLWAVENGITNGLSATNFGPNAICNRAQIVTFLYRAFN